MGRSDRERIARINAGTETPRAGIKVIVEKKLTCLLCKDRVPLSKVYQHIRDCWDMPINDGDPIPAKPPDDVIMKYLKRKAIAADKRARIAAADSAQDSLLTLAQKVKAACIPDTPGFTRKTEE